MRSSCIASKVSSGTEGPAAYEALYMMSGVVGSAGAGVEAAPSPKEQGAAARLFGVKVICGSLCERSSVETTIVPVCAGPMSPRSGRGKSKEISLIVPLEFLQAQEQRTTTRGRIARFEYKIALFERDITARDAPSANLSGVLRNNLLEPFAIHARGDHLPAHKHGPDSRHVLEIWL